MGPSYPGVLISGHAPPRETCDDLVSKKNKKSIKQLMNNYAFYKQLYSSWTGPHVLRGRPVSVRRPFSAFAAAPRLRPPRPTPQCHLLGLGYPHRDLELGRVYSAALSLRTGHSSSCDATLAQASSGHRALRENHRRWRAGVRSPRRCAYRRCRGRSTY